MAEAGQDPALDDLHGDLDLGLVAGVGRARGHDHRAVVLGELLVGALQAGLVAARDDHAALELVADDGGRDAAEEGEGALMAGDPVRDLLRAASPRRRCSSTRRARRRTARPRSARRSRGR